MRTAIVGAISVFLVGAVALAEGPARPGYRLIVNPQNSVTSLDRKFVAEAFLKRTTTWPQGDSIRPVDQGSDSSARRRFSDDILSRSVAAVKNYWQQAIFSGRDVPPPELDSDEDVVRYVLRFPGAIGYVSGTGDIGQAHLVTVK